MAIFENEGIRFHFQTLGAGFPLILCHGLGGDLTPMRSLFGEFHGFRTILWDCRGHGRTEPLGPTEAFTFATFARDLAALAHHLEIRRAVIGGVSMGAGISARFALDHPEAVAGLALIRPAWMAQPGPENLEIFRTLAALLEEKSPREALARFEGLPEACRIREVSEDVYGSLRNQFLLPMARERRVRLDRMPLSAPIEDWDEAARTGAPTLSIGSDRDPVHPLEFAEAWAAKIPDARFLQVVSKAMDLESHNLEVRTAVGKFVRDLDLAG